MSYYDEASFVFLPQAAAGSGAEYGGKAFTLKPVQQVSETELITNGDFSIDCTSPGGLLQEDVYGDWGWNFSIYGADSATTTILDGVMTMTTPAVADINDQGNPVHANLTYATTPQDNRNILNETGIYKLTYTVVYKKATEQSAAPLKGYWSGEYQNIPHEPGTHTVEFYHDVNAGPTPNRLFLFRLNNINDKIVLDNVSIRRVEQRSFDFPFDRGSNLAATRINKDGFVEKGTQNLFIHSNEFDKGNWTGAGFNLATTPFGVGLTPNQPAYDGTNTAWGYLKQSGSGSDYYNVLFSGLYTFSIYVKKAENTGFAIYSFNYVDADNNGVLDETPEGVRRVIVSLEDGSEINRSSDVRSSVTAVGDDWYRISLTRNVANQRFYIYTTQLDHPNGSQELVPMPIVIKDAQLERSMYPSAYMNSTEYWGYGGVHIDEPRFDYAKGSCPQLLLEAARTNRVTWSEDYSHSDWDPQTFGGNRTFKPNEQNPSGNYGCFEWHQVTVGNGEKIGMVCSGTPSVGVDATNSVYVKRVSGSGQVELVDANNSYTAFDLTEADGWKRLEVTSTVTGTPSPGRRHYLKMQNAGDKILIWGSQYEEGSGGYGYATSYIPTNGAQVTRSKDECDTLNDDPSGINLADHDFTVSFDIEEYKSGGTGLWYTYFANDAEGKGFFHYNDCIGWWRAPGAGQEIYQCNTFGSDAATARHRFVISSNAEEVKIYRDGEMIRHEDELVDSARYGLKRINLLYGAQNSARYNSILVFPKVLTNHESEILSGATSYESFGAMADANNYTTYV